MPLTFHWFLPTYGDSRSIVGGGHRRLAGTGTGHTAFLPEESSR